jgi:hypothetical protein
VCGAGTRKDASGSAKRGRRGTRIVLSTAAMEGGGARRCGYEGDGTRAGDMITKERRGRDEGCVSRGDEGERDDE